MLKIFLLVCVSVNVLVDSIPLDESVIEGHIIGGNNTDITKVPYQAAIYVTRHFWCGGVILSPYHILTAGHCVHGGRDDVIVIRVGSSSIKNGGEIARTSKIHRLSKFNDTTRDYDIAVIEVQHSLPLDNETMKAIKLATKEPSPGSVALVSGWGRIKEDGEEAKTLQSVAIPIVDRKICATNYKPQNKTVTPRMICAGAEGKAAYSGDDGGPLVYKDELVGIVSFRVGCGKKDLPGVYTNIADPEINKFIKSVVTF